MITECQRPESETVYPDDRGEIIWRGGCDDGLVRKYSLLSGC